MERATQRQWKRADPPPVPQHTSPRDMGVLTWAKHHSVCSFSVLFLS